MIVALNHVIFHWKSWLEHNRIEFLNFPSLFNKDLVIKNRSNLNGVYYCVYYDFLWISLYLYFLQTFLYEIKLVKRLHSATGRCCCQAQRCL